MNKSSEIFFDKINKVFEAIVPDNGKEKVEG